MKKQKEGLEKWITDSTTRYSSDDQGLVSSTYVTAQTFQ